MACSVTLRNILDYVMLIIEKFARKPQQKDWVPKQPSYFYEFSAVYGVKNLWLF